MLTQLTSSQLAEAQRQLAKVLEEAGSVDGMRRWSGGEEGFAGASLQMVAYRVGADECSVELKRVAQALNAQGEGTYAEAQHIDRAAPEAVAAWFDAWARESPQEDQALSAVAARVAALTNTYPSLRLYRVRSGDKLARNVGPALVDPHTREALWLYARAVRMTAHRR